MGKSAELKWAVEAAEKAIHANDTARLDSPPCGAPESAHVAQSGRRAPRSALRYQLLRQLSRRRERSRVQPARLCPPVD